MLNPISIVNVFTTWIANYDSKIDEKMIIGMTLVVLYPL